MSTASGFGKFPVKQAVVNKNTATSTAIVAAVPGKSIRLISYVLVSAGVVSVTWENGDGGDRSGPMPMAANTVIHAMNENGLLWTDPGQSLNLLLSAAIQVSGHITYIEVD